MTHPSALFDTQQYQPPPPPVVLLREQYPLQVTLHPAMAMRVEFGNWRPIDIQYAVDPECKAFAEAFRQLVLKLMRGTLQIPV